MLIVLFGIMYQCAVAHQDIEEIHSPIALAPIQVCTARQRRLSKKLPITETKTKSYIQEQKKRVVCIVFVILNMCMNLKASHNFTLKNIVIEISFLARWLPGWHNILSIASHD